MSAVVDQDQVGGQEEDGHHVADDNLAVDVVQLWHHDVHQESHHQEDAADDAADGVDEPDGVDVTLKTADVLTELRHFPDDLNPETHFIIIWAITPCSSLTLSTQ